MRVGGILVNQGGEDVNNLELLKELSNTIDFEGIGFKKTELTLAGALNFEYYEEYKGLLGVGFV